MSRPLIVLLTVLAMLAFAGNSLFCRIALKDTAIDAATFTSIRLLSGAATLWLILQWRRDRPRAAGAWGSALALYVYAICFSFAYIGLAAGTGALLLFGAVQATMIGYGLWHGERLHGWQVLGLALALTGLVGLMLPGISAPPLLASLLMLTAGAAWGIYSLRGRGGGDPMRVTTGNFLRTVPLAVATSLVALPWQAWDATGALYAVASGALASGVGYAVWYAALRGLRATTAATVQLSVPVIVAVGGVIFLSEPVTLRLVVTSAAILGGIALVIIRRQSA